VRKNLALMTALVITVIIAGIWAGATTNKFKSPGTLSYEAKGQKGKSPFSLVGTEAGNLVSQVKDGIGDIKSTIKESKEVGAVIASSTLDAGVVGEVEDQEQVNLYQEETNAEEE